MLNVVHVDDSKFLLRTSAKIIKDVFKDVNIITLTDEEIVKKLEENETFENVDVFFTDLLMPAISGHNIIKHIKRVNTKCLVVVVSSNVQTTEKELCYSNGADYFLEKPLTIEKLKNLEEVCYGRSE